MARPAAPPIPGDYQYRANFQGPVVQRFFHHQRRLLVDWLLQIAPTDRVLDAGCGSGVFAAYMSQRAASVLAIDILDEAVGFARRTFPRPNLTFRCEPLHRIALPDASVDKILMAEVVEHLTPEYQQLAARELDRVLGPGGRILVTSPNYRSPWPLVEWISDALDLFPSLRAQHVTHTSAAYFRRCAFNGFARLSALGCFSYVAPLLAPLHWGVAEAVARLEFRLPLPGGLQLYALWVKPR